MGKKHRSLLRDELVARPLSEWHEDDGPVLWWRFPVDEPPYIGTPDTLGQTVEVSVTSFGVDKVMRFNIGGWPGYHTHWTKITVPLIALPEDARLHALGAEPSSASHP